MTPTWDDGDPPPPYHISAVGWLLVLVRALALIVLVFGGLAFLLLIRLMERPLCGLHRPVTPHITQFVCRWSLRIIGLHLYVTGAPMQGREAVVANHSSWLDIFVLNASKRLYFVSKSEVANWPGIGWLARATGTVFIKRDPAQARAQTLLFQERLLSGHKLLFFPEGTSTDGMRVLQFKTTLFQSFFSGALRDVLSVQPVSVVYTAPRGTHPRFYGWWGDMDFGSHLLKTLSSVHPGRVDVIYHAALPVADSVDRKALAKACEDQVRHGHQMLLGKAD